MKLNKRNSIVLLILSLVGILFAGYIAGFGLGDKKTGSAENITLGLDLKGGVSITYEVQDKEFTKEQLSDTVYKLQKRVSIFSTESEVYKEGQDRITIDIPGQYDTKSVIAELGRPGSLMFVTEADESFEGDETYPLHVAEDGTRYKVWLTGSDVDEAQARTQNSSNTGASEYLVSLQMKSTGTKKFADATTANIGKSISILYDDKVISSPIVESAITTGEAVINKIESFEEADSLATTIRIGSLSLDLKETTSKVVSAKLGNDAIETSLIAGAIGLLLVMAFMIIVYRIPGVISSIALILYTILELLVLNGFDLTLTLPGIAGIILSIGMAVDANVIIYARIKEELAAGKTTDSAIKVGFKKATSAIIDGNVTTFIAAVILMWKGTGPVQGFAITLAIGIILSMLTAMFVSRFLVNLFYNMGFKDKKYYGVQLERKTIDFVKRRYLWFAIAIISMLIGVVGMAVNSANDKGAFEYSIEFKGGTATNLEFAEDISIDKFNNEIKPELAQIIGSNDIQGQKETGSNRYTIKTPVIDEVEIRESFKQKLIDNFGADKDSFEETNISSSVSKEMQSDAIVAVGLATFCMLLYIWIRFKNLKFASSAIIALLHDVVIVLGFYALSRTTVGTTFIACVLTIVGYSINATIVIFDRIRENIADQNKTKKIDIKEIVNLSITQTLTRSIYTSFTTFITVFVLFVMGVAAIQEFALPIMIGILAGGFSSVFITGSLWYLISRKEYEDAKN